MAETVRDRDEMIRRMAPRLEHDCYVFTTARDEADLVRRLPLAVAMFREPEGISLIVPAPSDAAGAMRLITLGVASALDGVGLTAAVSAALAGAGIPCNIVAATQHDHIFVPVAQAERALDTLRALARSGAPA